MNFFEFKELIDQTRKRKPILFGLKSDRTATQEQIEYAENLLGIIMPESYKQFLREYGGGYFGFAKVYSLDESGPNYICAWNDSQKIHASGYVAAIDLEDGDTAGFCVKNGVCGEEIYYFDHENGEITKSPYDDFFSFIVSGGLKLS